MLFLIQILSVSVSLWCGYGYNPNLTYHFDAGLDADPEFFNANPDPDFFVDPDPGSQNDGADPDPHNTEFCHCLQICRFSSKNTGPRFEMTYRL